MTTPTETKATEVEFVPIDTLTSFRDYVPLAKRTESPTASLVTDKEVLSRFIGINILTADVLDGFKKQMFYGKEEKLKENLRDNVFKLYALLNELVVMTLGQPTEEGFNTDNNPGLYLGDILETDTRTLHALLGTVTEAGELSELLLKLVDGETVDAVNLQEEFADISWYQAIAFDANGLDFYQGITNNVNKLRRRYPEKFTAELATHRDLDAERAELEVGNTTEG